MAQRQKVTNQMSQTLLPVLFPFPVFWWEAIPKDLEGGKKQKLSSLRQQPVTRLWQTPSRSLCNSFWKLSYESCLSMRSSWLYRQLFLVLTSPEYTEFCLLSWVWGQWKTVKTELEDPALLYKWGAQVRALWRVQTGKAEHPDRRGGASSAEKESSAQGRRLLLGLHRSSYKHPDVALRFALPQPAL